MAYADDIVIGIIGITLIKKVIKVINCWTKEYDMSFNQSKTKIMFHNKFWSFSTYNQETFMNMQIARSTKVLGFMIDSRSNNLEQIKYIKEKMKKAKKM